MSILLEDKLKQANTNPGHEPVRFWGTEFEHPHAGNRWHRLDGLIFEVKHDGSVPSGGESCDCPKCSHSCNCYNCSVSRYCGNAGLQEVALLPTNRRWHWQITDFLEALKETGVEPDTYCDDYCSYHDSRTCEDDGEDTDYCETSESENNWGFHTHIDARDLTLRQVATATRLLTDLLQRFEGAFGEDCYNAPLSERELSQIPEGYLPHRQSTVNPRGIITYFNSYSEAERQDPRDTPRASSKATIEVRQLRFTTDPELHEARVAFCRAVVDYVKANKPVFWLARERDFDKVLAELEINKH